jgi:hypothetical protein
LQRRVDEAKSLVEVDGIYYHYKSPDKYYVVESVGLLEGSEEVCVIYRALYDKGLVWVRPLDDFCSEVEKDGEVMERFSRIS